MLESPQHRSCHSGRKTLLIRIMSFKVGILHQINTDVAEVLHFFVFYAPVYQPNQSKEGHELPNYKPRTSYY